MRSAGRLSAVGWEFAIATIGCFLAGYWADKKLGTSPGLTIGGLALGMSTGFWILFKAVRQMTKEADELEREERRGGSDRGSE